ncbi:MAG: ATP-binding cassette domain-containing protein [Candidatus Eremiobacteraeota bacterium]|nr:ATP-binding cassette domain-containing protein [Candidatus Eremiobacteraeota bacterium]
MKDDFLIGRDRECDLVLESPLVSRFHARLRNGVLQDLDSANGTFVNGVLVRNATLSAGQRVTVGPYHLLYEEGTLRSKGRGLSVSCQQLTYQPPGFSRPLLHDLNLEVPQGTFLAVVGTSGAGKSTLMKLMAGLSRPTSGQVLYDGRPQSSPEFQRSVGWVPQEEIVHAHLQVKVALKFSAELRLPRGTSPEEIERRVHYAAEQVTLSHRLESPILRLSGGEKKRVALAAEELGDPDIFFLDEPTSGLDPGLEKEIMMSLRDLSRRGRTVVLITHATDNIKLCDSLLFLAPGGHPVYHGPPEGATGAFGVEDFAEIYRLLTDPAWFEKHGQSLAAKTRDELKKSGSEAATLQETSSSSQANRRWNPLQQLRLLLSRELYLTMADRSNTILFLLQAPIIALILGQLFPKDLFSLTQSLNSQGKFPVMEAPTMLFMLVVASLFFGAVNSCRELVKERSIYIRERLLGVRPELYLLSKVILLGLKGLISVGLLLGGVALFIPLPWTVEEFLLALGFCWATYMGGVGLGLVLSALAGTAEQATTLVTVVLIIQLMLSGAFIPADSMSSPLAQLSVLAVCRWGLAGLSYISEINLRFSELHMPFLTSDFFLTPSEIWSIFVPLVVLHLLLPLLILYRRSSK